jgi:hypothetical protein
MAVTIQHKRGDTFDHLLLLPEADFPDGYFLLWDVASQIRTARGKLIAELETSWATPASETRILRLFASETSDWPVGDQEVDVQFTRQSDGLVRSTETIAVQVLRDVTQP